MLSKAATTHWSSEPWMTSFAPDQDLLANTEILRQKCPYLERGYAKMLKHVFSGGVVIKGKHHRQKTEVSQGPRCLLCHFLLHASTTESLHSPPVLLGFPIRFSLALMLWRWSGHNEMQGRMGSAFPWGTCNALKSQGLQKQSQRKIWTHYLLVILRN